jgi:hypothetical protein
MGRVYELLTGKIVNKEALALIYKDCFLAMFGGLLKFFNYVK